MIRLAKKEAISKIHRSKFTISSVNKLQKMNKIIPPGTAAIASLTKKPMGFVSGQFSCNALRIQRKTSLLSLVGLTVSEGYYGTFSICVFRTNTQYLS